MRVTRAHGSEHAIEDNQFMGVVELPEGAIVKLKLKIDKKLTNMQLKVFLEAELAQKINKYLHSSHRYGDFSDLVRASDFCEIDNQYDTNGYDGRSDSKIHASS